MEFYKRRRGCRGALLAVCWWICWSRQVAGAVIAEPTSTTTVPTTEAHSTTANSQTRAINFNGPVTSGRKWLSSGDEPTHPPPIATVITAQSGDTAFLPCHVPLKEEHGVSWIRRRDWSILAADKKIYSHDERFRVSFADAPDSTWTLLIKFIRKDDEGIYDCQISTRRGVTSQSIELRIVEPQAILVGAPDVYVGVGSPFTITCAITNTLKPPEYVLWYLDAKSLNFGSENGRSNGGSSGGTAGIGAAFNGLSSSLSSSSSSGSSSSASTGHTVTFEPGPPSVSRLSVHSATAADSGRYTCQPSSGMPASTDVHVALGNEMAPIQAADAAGRGRAFRWMSLVVSVSVTLLNSLRWSSQPGLFGAFSIPPR